MRATLLLSLFVLSTPIEAFAVTEKRPDRLSLNTDRVVVFKDGHGLFAKSGSAVADAEGRVFTDQVPDAAVLGSFWAVSDDGKAIGAMRAEWDEQRTERTVETAAITHAELLRANPGRNVTITYRPAGESQPAETFTGTLLEVLDLPPLDAKLHEVHGGTGSIVSIPPNTPGAGLLHTVRELVPRGGSLAVLDSGDRGRVVIPIEGIRTLAGRDLVTRMVRKEEVFVRSKRLTFELGKEAAGKTAKLRLFYFTPGIRWIPTYRVSGDLKDSADLQLQGEILNEEEDITGAALDLVVGVPSFRFKGTVSPLSLERVLRNALVQAAPDLMGQGGNQFSNAMFSQRAGEYRGNAHGGEDGAEYEGGMEIPAELAASGEHDLFVYGVKSFTLKKGGRGTVSLWKAQVPVRHLYTLDADVVRNADSTKYASVSKAIYGGSAGVTVSKSPLHLNANQVWHQLEMSNPANGGVPWTTGAAFIMSGSLPLGQDLLTYTPAGRKALVPITVAVDLRGDVEEEEIERKANALKWNGDHYTLVKKRGQVTIRSSRKESSTVLVRVGVGGKADTVSDAGAIKVQDFRQSDWNGGYFQPALNPHSEITWEVTLKAGETKTVNYTVGFYTR